MNEKVEISKKRPNLADQSCAKRKTKGHRGKHLETREKREGRTLMKGEKRCKRIGD